MQITTVTTKGQITLPAEIRKKRGIKPGDKVQISEEKGEIKVKPVADFFSFKGALKGRRLPSENEMEQIAAREAVERYIKTFKK